MLFTYSFSPWIHELKFLEEIFENKHEIEVDNANPLQNDLEMQEEYFVSILA